MGRALHVHHCHLKRGASELTNRLKTVQNPRVILIDCDNVLRISEIISDILNYCSYNTLIDCFSENTDFIVLTNKENLVWKNVIADTVTFDNKSKLDEEIINKFRSKVTSYEYCFSKYDEEAEGFLTYSTENYDAEVMCRNISMTDNTTSFDIIEAGILSRVRIHNNLYSVQEVLICTCTLIATGIPIASILGYFNACDEK